MHVSGGKAGSHMFCPVQSYIFVWLPSKNTNPLLHVTVQLMLLEVQVTGAAFDTLTGKDSLKHATAKEK